MLTTTIESLLTDYRERLTLAERSTVMWALSRMADEIAAEPSHTPPTASVFELSIIAGELERDVRDAMAEHQAETLCPNCGGTLHAHDEECPYFGVDLDDLPF